MNAEQIKREIEELQAGLVTIERETQAIEQRQKELNANWHRLSGAIIAYKKVLEQLRPAAEAPAPAAVEVTDVADDDPRF